MSTLNLATIQSNTALPPTIQNSSAVEIGTFCRAWVNFNGTGTVAIRASFNVSSITDNTVGDYTVNFTTAMPDANYGVNGIVQFNQSGSTSDHYLMALEIQNISTAMQTGSVRVVGKYAQSVSPYDMTTICVSIFR